MIDDAHLASRKEKIPRAKLRIDVKAKQDIGE